MRLITTRRKAGAFLATACLFTTPAYADGGIALGARAPHTTLTTISGVDTANAIMQSTLTRADFDDCANGDGQACSTGDLAPGETFTFAADCVTGTVVDVSGKQFVRQRVWMSDESGAGMFEGRAKFVDTEGATMPASNAHDGGRLAVNYERLCPANTQSASSTQVVAGGGVDIMNPAQLDGRIIWDHNGSEMLIDAEEGVIVYNAPKASIWKAVKIGQVLVRGNISHNGPVSGTAYVFKTGCNPAPYEVKGRWSDDGELVLRGAAPKRSKSGCGIDGYTKTGGNAELRFTFLMSP